MTGNIASTTKEFSRLPSRDKGAAGLAQCTGSDTGRGLCEKQQISHISDTGFQTEPASKNRRYVKTRIDNRNK